MIDTHAHLNYPPLAGDAEGVLARALEVGVDRVIIPGTARETSESAVAMAGQFPGVYAAVGVHPSDAHETEASDIERIQTLIMNPKVVAVGEVGLDYHYEFDALSDSEVEARKARQKGLLWQMIDLAREHKKPLIIHSRECFDDLYDILKRDASDMKVVIHCFTGNQTEADLWLNLGFYLSFTGIVTYKSAGELREVVKTVPWERMMIETDAPYLAPQAFRGDVCEPAMVAEVAKLIAEVRGVSVDEVNEHTTSTAETFFNLP